MAKLQYYLIVVFIVFNTLNVNGQEYIHTKNTVYYEFGGTGYGAFSVNYERNIKLSETVFLAPGLGVSLTDDMEIGGTKSVGDYQLLVPWQVNLLFGKYDHLLETGFGMPIAIEEEKFGLVGNIYVLRLGYRYHHRKSGFMFRASLNPTWFALVPKIRGGLSVGYAF